MLYWEKRHKRDSAKTTLCQNILIWVFITGLTSRCQLFGVEFALFTAIIHDERLALELVLFRQHIKVLIRQFLAGEIDERTTENEIFEFLVECHETNRIESQKGTEDAMEL